MRFTKGHVWLLIGVILLFAAQAAEAQEICYAYDKLGRLIGVIDQQGQTGIYDYDAVGNILAIRRIDATGPVAITLVSSNNVAAGEQVQILGIGFSETPSENQVTIDGIPTTVMSSIGCSLTVEIPAGITSADLRVTTPFGSAVLAGAFNALGAIVSPAKATMPVGTSRQFTVTITGTADQRVIWSVNDIEGGNATVGTISQLGIYTAPVTVPTPATVAVQATSVPHPGFFAEAVVTIVGEGIRFAHAAPVSVSFGPPAQGTITSAPVSVNFGPPPLGTIVSPAVSVFFGIPPASVFAHDVSVANAPVIVGVSPDNGAQGAPVALTLTGFNFTGATELVFLLNGGLIQRSPWGA